MDYIWKTEMRASSTTADTTEEAQRRDEARAADQLSGQAALTRLSGGRWELITMPDARSFYTSAVISADDARALAHAILDADRHPMEAVACARVDIIDLTQQDKALNGDKAADRYQAMHDRPMPEHDYRFRAIDPVTGSEWTAGTQYTATDVMTSIEHDRKMRAAGL
jgi:hypothetical protein